jgi:hypothetical protein
MTTYHEFDKKAVQGALDAAQAHNEMFGVSRVSHDMDISAGGDFLVAAECISVTVENNKVCLNLPLGFGKVCLPIPVSIPNGTAAKACLKICTTWGIPTGIKVTVEVGGIVIVSKTFGKC